MYSKKFCDLGTMSYYLWKIVSVEKIWTLVNCILDAWQITWQFEPNLLMVMEVFQNICFMSCDLLGSYVYLGAKSKNIMFFVILRHDL